MIVGDNKQTNNGIQKLAHTFPQASFGTKFVQIDKAVEAKQTSEINTWLEAPLSLRTLPTFNPSTDFFKFHV